MRAGGENGARPWCDYGRRGQPAVGEKIGTASRSAIMGRPAPSVSSNERAACPVGVVNGTRGGHDVNRSLQSARGGAVGRERGRENGARSAPNCDMGLRSFAVGENRARPGSDRARTGGGLCDRCQSGAAHPAARWFHPRFIGSTVQRLSTVQRFNCSAVEFAVADGSPRVRCGPKVGGPNRR